MEVGTVLRNKAGLLFAQKPGPLPKEDFDLTRTLYQKPADPVKETPEEKRKQRALSLFEQGYRAQRAGDCITITTPRGGKYTVDPHTPSCDCKAYSIALHRGNPTCKHIEGAELLATRCERHTLTEEQILVVDNRNLMFMAEMPVLLGHFDNGVHQGEVRIVGQVRTCGERLLVVKRMDSDQRFMVRPSDVTVDGFTNAHLTKVAEYVARWHAAGPISGTYRQGNTRQWTGRGYR